MKANSASVIEKSLFWQRHVLNHSKCPKQKARALLAIACLEAELLEGELLEGELLEGELK
jgi:chromosome condensin MukBEF complex kleisin-like MukF subunit